ncbi:hypothetical protein PR202_ga22202 [Eleusine coracana subsp. coracana]|uniref:Uncharacterized protein n=1 Tax=Eleusine coracana subsp. coracana TaxID=191504 RepID=A0AAV5D2R4_ELECO|nr:hypothetical protein PR202_ga22202 [Eleusine coracana subsp. coracana]
MSTLLPKLADLLKEEYNLQKSVKGEIMFLEAELESMRTALLKVSVAPIDQPPDIQVILWARDVRELSYDIEDHVDTFMVRVDSHIPNKLRGVKGLIDRSGNLMKKTSIRRKIGIAVKDIKSHITEVSQRRDRYKVHNITSKPVGTTIHSLRLSALYNDMTKLVGIEEKSDHLVKRLMKGHQASRGQLEIVSIVGFGGLGKTTLAKIVYDKIKDQFDCGAFVSISLNPNMEKIFKSMIHQIDMSEYSKINDATLDEVALIEKLREILEKRYVQS